MCYVVPGLYRTAAKHNAVLFGPITLASDIPWVIPRGKLLSQVRAATYILRHQRKLRRKATLRLLQVSDVFCRPTWRDTIPHPRQRRVEVLRPQGQGVLRRKQWPDAHLRVGWRWLGQRHDRKRSDDAPSPPWQWCDCVGISASNLASICPSQDEARAERNSRQSLAKTQLDNDVGHMVLLSAMPMTGDQYRPKTVTVDTTQPS